MKRTFNIWKEMPLQFVAPTGPWAFQSAVYCETEEQAIEVAKMRHGSDGKYKIYEGL